MPENPDQPTIYISKDDETYIRITGEKSVLYEISERFTFFADGYQFHPSFKAKYWDGKIRLFSGGRLYLGLHPYVKAYCEENGYGCVYVDPELSLETEFSVVQAEKMFAALNLSVLNNGVRESIVPHDYQKKAVIHAIQAKRSLLLSPTASGKSLLIYILTRYYLARTKGKVLLVVPTTSLVSQMFDDFTDYADLVPWSVEANCHKVYDGAERTTEKRVVISTWQSLATKERLSKERRKNMSASQVAAYNKKAKYVLDQDYFDLFDTVFGDEAHGFSSEELTNLLAKLTNARYRHGTTGTLKDAKANQMVLEGLFGQVYRTTTTKQLMDDGNVAELFIHCLQLTYSDAERKQMKKATYPEEIEFLTSHEGRNRFICNLALSLKGNTLVLFEKVEKHGKVLYEQIARKAAAGRKIFYVHGGVDADDRNAIRKITEGETNAVIVASFGTFSVGVSIRNIDNVIFASTTKSKIRVLQSIGRGLRKSKRKSKVALYDLADDLSTWNKARTESKDNYSMKHFVERIQFYIAEQFAYKQYRIALSSGE